MEFPDYCLGIDMIRENIYENVWTTIHEYLQIN